MLQNLNNIKNYEVGTKKQTSLLGIPRNPRDQHIPLNYGNRVRIYNGNKFYLHEPGNNDAWFSRKTYGNASIMKIYKAHGGGRWGIAGWGTIKYGDFIFIEAQRTERKLQRAGRNARFQNRNLGSWEKFIIEKGPGSKGNHGTPIYSGDIIYIRSWRDRRPFRLQKNRENNARFQNYNKQGWERMVITIV